MSEKEHPSILELVDASQATEQVVFLLGSEKARIELAIKISKKKTARDVAKIVGSSERNIFRLLRKYGLEVLGEK